MEININDLIWSWPLITYIVSIAVVMTVGLRFVQFRHFFDAWRYLFKPEKEQTGDMTPFQAFINALSTSVGNGSIAGTATAIASGGPGAAFWMFIYGLLGMGLRFAEVYLATLYPPISHKGSLVGGPMVYLKKVPGGSFLPYIYGTFMFLLGLFSGNAMQANSIRLGLVRTMNLDYRLIAVVLFLFIIYVMVGGAQRIVKVSDAIVPVKVGVFFVTAIFVLLYHAGAIVPALKLIITSALTPGALLGGMFGYTVQQALRFGLARTSNSSEAGLGTAAVLFGGSGSKDPYKSGVMSMASVFISANLVSFSIAVIIIASGVWNSGLTSIDLTSSAYETVFGSFGTWLVTFLSVSFGLGVLVSYAYVARACWLFLTDGKYVPVFTAVFCCMTLFGALADVAIVWHSVDFVNAGLLLTNLFGMLWLLPTIRRDMARRA